MAHQSTTTARIGKDTNLRPYQAAWPDLFTNLQAAYSELTRTQFELQHRAAELEEARDLFRLVIQSMSDGLFLLDRAGRITEVNPAAERLLNRRAGEVLGQAFSNAWPTPEIPSTPWQFLERAPTGELSDVEVMVPSPDGRIRAVSVSNVLVRDKRGKIVGMVIVARDITQRKEAEQELARQARDLERSNADLEQFAYVASHDLQEPLRMMASFSELLGERYRGRLDPDADKYLHFIVDGARRMQRLIIDLLDYSRVGTRGRELVPTDCMAVLEAVVDNLRAAIQDSGAEVSVGMLPTVMGDEMQLVQLFQNLIGNAIKFRSEAPPRVEVGVERRGAEWVFRVRDNGIGIDPRHVERIFLIFQRLHSKRYAGTGIGLAICKKIVERHGGRMWVDSELGKGSTFFFTLKAEDSEAWPSP